MQGSTDRSPKLIRDVQEEAARPDSDLTVVRRSFGQLRFTRESTEERILLLESQAKTCKLVTQYEQITEPMNLI